MLNTLYLSHKINLKKKKWFGGSTSTKWFFIYLIPGWIGIWKLVFEERSTCRKPLGAKERTKTNSNHIWCWHWDLNPGHTTRLYEPGAINPVPLGESWGLLSQKTWKFQSLRIGFPAFWVLNWVQKSDFDSRKCSFQLRFRFISHTNYKQWTNNWTRTNSVYTSSEMCEELTEIQHLQN